MSDTPTSRAERRLFVAWVAFATLNYAAMVALPNHETIPFHFVWISMAVVYGVYPWSPRTTAVVLLLVVTFTGWTIQDAAEAGRVDWQEITEVPLMALVFLTMVWHVRRRVAALRESELMAERERRAHEVQELFVRRCSHEMRTPITVARGYTDLVRVDLLAGEAREDLGIVLDELAKLDHLTGRLLELASAYESTGFDLAAVDLGLLVERTGQRWRQGATREWIVVAERVTIVADASRLEAALDALVENAVKFTLDGDRVALRCKRHDDTVTIEVEDAGVGFYRSAELSGPPHSSGTRGTGLGLSIVEAIVEGHGGRLEALDRPANGGALVRVTLPLSRVAVATAPRDNVIETAEGRGLVRYATVSAASSLSRIWGSQRYGNALLRLLSARRREESDMTEAPVSDPVPTPGVAEQGA